MYTRIDVDSVGPLTMSHGRVLNRFPGLNVSLTGELVGRIPSRPMLTAITAIAQEYADL